MYRKKISMMILAATIMNQIISPVTASASPAILVKVAENKTDLNEGKQEMSIKAFNLYQNAELDAYNKVYRMDPANIAEIRKNGGKYGSSTIDKAIDGDFKIHWEDCRNPF